MPKSSEYVLQVGESGKDRLSLLHEIYGPYSQAFVSKIKLRPNSSVLDIACGTGNMTLWMSEHFGPKIEVVGVDISQKGSVKTESSTK